MSARRLPAAPARGEERVRVTFTFDGRRHEGVEGEPVAVSLLAAGRRTLSRSFRFHRPRGLMCSTGQCGWCECEVDGQPSVRTCGVPVREGMVVRGEHAWPSVERDLLAALDLGSRFVPPTFYHHRFLRPRRLRKSYLDVLRWFGGRGRLGRGSSIDRRSRAIRQDDPDVLVVGAGRSGLLAALGAAETGARVVVLEAETMTDRDPAVGDLLAEAGAKGVDVRTGTTATGWYAGQVTALDDAAAWELRPGAVVAATGSYESIPSVPGSDRPGLMGARLVGRLLARYGVLPGERALLVGAGEELGSVGAALEVAGATVLGPVPTSALLAIGGRGAVAWASFVDGTGSVRRQPVELVVVGDRTPNLDLVLAAGGRVGWSDGRLVPEATTDGATSVPGLFVAACAAAQEPAIADERAREAGRAAARFAHGAPPAESGAGDAHAVTATTRRGDPPRSPTAGRPPPPGAAGAVLCFCEDVRGREIQAERTAGYGDPELAKRRTGALTGPCQGKYCLSAVTCALAADGEGWPGPPGRLPTSRPPLRPIRLGDLVVDDGPAGTPDHP